MKEYYEFIESTGNSLLESAVVLHISGKEKPWLYVDTPFSKEWDGYFAKSPFGDVELKREYLDRSKSKTKEICINFKQSGMMTKGSGASISILFKKSVNSLRRNGLKTTAMSAYRIVKLKIKSIGRR